MINKQRRRVVQGMACSALAPALMGLHSRDALNTTQTAELLCTSADPRCAVSGDSSDISLEFSDPDANQIDGLMARFEITNHGTESVELRHLSPGAVSTRFGVYNINTVLADKVLELKPGEIRQIWLEPAADLPTHLPAPMGHRTMVQLKVVMGSRADEVELQSRKIHAVLA